MRTTDRPTTHRPPRSLLTVREVAELDGCSDKTVRRAIAAGLLEVIRIDPAAYAAYRGGFRA